MQISFNFSDIIFGALILIAIVRCVLRGFVAEFMSMAAVILGVLMAVLFAGNLGGLIDQLFSPSTWNRLIAFLVIFLLVYLIVKLIEKALHNTFEKLKLEKLDKALGLFLGIVEGLLLVAVVVFVLDLLKSIELFEGIGTWLPESFFATFLLAVIRPLTASLNGKE